MLPAPTSRCRCQLTNGFTDKFPPRPWVPGNCQPEAQPLLPSYEILTALPYIEQLVDKRVLVGDAAAGALIEVPGTSPGCSRRLVVQPDLHGWNSQDVSGLPQETGRGLCHPAVGRAPVAWVPGVAAGAALVQVQ